MRAAKFAPAEARLDPAEVERWIDEELAGLEKGPPAGSQPLDIPGVQPGPVLPPAPTFKEALARVDLSGMPAERARLRAGWQRYRRRPGARLHSQDDYIRFVYGKRTGQLPGSRWDRATSGLSGRSSSRPDISWNGSSMNIFPPGVRTLAISQPGTATFAPTTFRLARRRFISIPMAASASRAAACRSPPNMSPTRSTANTPTNDQTRGFVQLADSATRSGWSLYVKWQDHFPDPSGLVRDFDVGYNLPDRYVSQIVGSGVREEARKAGVKSTSSRTGAGVKPESLDRPSSDGELRRLSKAIFSLIARISASRIQRGTALRPSIQKRRSCRRSIWVGREDIRGRRIRSIGETVAIHRRVIWAGIHWLLGRIRSRWPDRV